MPEMDVAMTGMSEEWWQEHTHAGCIHGGNNRIAQSHMSSMGNSCTPVGYEDHPTR